MDETIPLSYRDHFTTGINVNRYKERYRVRNPKVQEALHAFPTLCYLLGEVTAGPQTTDTRPDGKLRPVYFLMSGSGMFGLENADDAMRWKVIFNHIVGTARQVQFLSERFTHLSPGQRKIFADSGFDTESITNIDPILLTQFQLISHAGRRQTDERTWHNLNDNAHPPGDSNDTTVALLSQEAAPLSLLDLMRIEYHTYLLQSAAETGQLPNLIDNILTYCDWTYGQQPQTLKSRFDSLRASGRSDVNILNGLEQVGNAFEQILLHVFGEDLANDMAKTQKS